MQGPTDNNADSDESDSKLDPQIANYTLEHQNNVLVGSFSDLLQVFSGFDNASVGLVAVFDAFNNSAEAKYVVSTLGYVLNDINASGKGMVGARGLGLLLQSAGTDSANSTAWGMSTLLETMARSEGHKVARSARAFGRIMTAIGSQVSDRSV